MVRAVPRRKEVCPTEGRRILRDGLHRIRAGKSGENEGRSFRMEFSPQSTRRVAPDVHRSMAVGAGLFLRSKAPRHRLAAESEKVSPSGQPYHGPGGAE